MRQIFRLCGYTCIEAIKFVWHNIGLKDHTKNRKASGDKCDESRYMKLGGTPFSLAEGKDLERWDTTRSEKF